jgi:osmotically-inducible protein OsmY
MKLAKTSFAPHSARRALLVGMCAVMALPLLQGCFPVMVAGIGGAALVAADRRTAGAVAEDQSIEWKVASTLRKHFGTLNHINTTSYNRNVLLTGQVQNEEVRAEAGHLTSTVANVRGVFNELVIAPPLGFGARSNDTAISTNVKTRFLPAGGFKANHVKVVTEAGTVFLLGVVTRAEGEEAVKIASDSKGVKTVVRVFEYIDENEAKVLDARNNDSLPPEAP